MMIKVFDLLRGLGWYIIDFIYELIDNLLKIINKINAFDIINAISNNKSFKGFYTGIMAIAITLFALFIIWKIINKFLNYDEDNPMKNIISEIFKCGTMILMSTFLFIQVSNFSITLSNYTSNIFKNNETKMSNEMLSMFITYRDGYKNSDKFKEEYSINELVNNGSFDNDELYLSKYVTKSRIILADKKDYKYDINWIMAILCGGFFLYSLFFVAIMLGRKHIEFLFLFTISPIVFATSVCNKQRRGAVIEQLVSLTLQSAVVMLIINLTVMAMQEINTTTFFVNKLFNLTTKSLLYIGCATFILTGSQVVNRFIGANVSASSGREQLMSLMGYGKMASIGTTLGTNTLLGGGLLATGTAMKGMQVASSQTLEKAGIKLGNMGPNTDEKPTTKMQKMAHALGSSMVVTSQKLQNKANNKSNISDTFINLGKQNINNTVARLKPRLNYNSAYYSRRKI